MDGLSKNQYTSVDGISASLNGQQFFKLCLTFSLCRVTIWNNVSRFGSLICIFSKKNLTANTFTYFMEAHVKRLKSNFLPVIVLFGMFLAFTPVIWGNNSEDEEKAEYYFVKKNESIVVTAALSPQALKDCSSSMSVVGKREIETIFSTSALGILGNFPGIFVTRSGDFGRADVDIRGLGQNCRRIAVLVDGKPEKMGLYGCAVSHAFPLDNVERVEVVKGAASVLYGGEALGGAVNIITRMPQKPFELDVFASYGSYNTGHFNLKTGGKTGAFTFFASADKIKSDGHIENSRYSGYSLTGKGEYAFSSNTHITFQGKYFDGEKDEPGTVNNPVTGYWNDYKRGSADVTFSHNWEDNSVNVKLFRNFGKHRFSDGWDSRDYTDGIMASFTYKGITRNEMILGGDFRHFGGKSFGYPVGKWDKEEGAVFVQDTYRVGSRMIVLGGLRLQLDSLYGSEWCPRWGVVYHVSGTMLFRGEISKGFRSPQLNELYMFPPANKDLQPERVWNYELGVEKDFSPNFHIKGSVFHMKGSNLIETVANPAGFPKFIFANTGSFSFYGMELEMDAFFLRYFSGNVSWSYLHSGDYTKGRPGQKYDLSLIFNRKQLMVALQGQYVTDYFESNFSVGRIPSYFIMNARVSMGILNDVDLILDLQNITNKYYCIYGEFPGLTAGLYRMPGRNIQIGVRYRL